jgi:drug/metabolite transporter (DMT)-like permease
METYVFVILLITACLHAGWNAQMKALALEPFTKAALFAGVQALIAAPLLLIFGFPGPATYPYLFLGVIFSSGYMILLMQAYQFGQVSQVYPIVRGSAVIITAAISLVLPHSFFPGMGLGEGLTVFGCASIAILAVGVILLSVPAKGDQTPYNRRTIAFALVTAVCLSLGLVGDGSGARASSSTFSYLAATFVLQGIVCVIVAITATGWSTLRSALAEWKTGCLAGLMAALSYGIAIWAMTLTLIPKVQAVRETSVLVATFIGVVKLKEPLRPIRVLAALLIFGGLVLVRLR